MTRPAPQSMHVAVKRAAFLALASAALVVSVSGVGGQPPDAKSPAQPPAKPGDVPELQLRWSLDVKKAPEVATVLFDHDGQLVVVSGRVKIEAVSFNARTGKAGPELPTVDVHPYRTLLLEKGKIAFQQGRSSEKELVVWDTTNGKTSRVAFPTVGPGLQSLSMSPNGRYTSVSEWRTVKGGGISEMPLRVFDGKTSKPVVSFDWQTGTIHFTADASRVLTVDATDRFRWFKLPSGQTDGEWKFEREASRANAKILGMSADGGVILYHGQPPKKELGLHLLDGRTGDVLHSFPARTYLESTGLLSPDGRSVVLLRTDGFGPGHTVELLDTRGAVLAKVAVLRTGNGALEVAASWEARAVAVYDRGLNKLWVYDLPGGSGNVGLRPKGRDAAAANRTPVPGDAAVAKAEAGVRQILKDDYARKQPAERKALAQKLITLADQTADDPAARYVMLRDARDFAVEVADPVLAVHAIDGLAKWYQVEGSVQKLAALEKILTASSSAAVLKVIAEAAGPAADDALADDEFDEATQFAQLAANAARKGKLGQAAIDDAEYRLAHAKKARDSFAAIRPALEKLKTDPDDRDANSAVGKYRCFVQNRWDDGLKHLARGANTALRELAELDLKTPRTGVPPDAKIADAWWDYAQSAPTDEQWAVQTRTRYWYGRCIPGLTGLNKAKAEARLVFTSGGIEYRPGLVCEFSAKQSVVLKGKKARIDAVIDFSGGEFSDSGKQTDLTLKWAGLLVPPQAGRYELIAQTNDSVRVRVDGKLVIDTVSAKGKREAQVTLGEKPTPIVVEFSAPNTDRHKLKLAWVVPGGSGDEPIPAECLFHDKKAEAALGK
jgi:PA14 domain